MQRLSKLTAVFAVGLSVVTAGVWATGKAESGWVSLFDGKAIGSEWNQVGDSNWRVEDGVIVADKLTSEDAAHLVTKNSYKDFQLYVEFWSSDDANSGVFLRCQDPSAITLRSCYEVNIFDQRPDQSYGTGGIVLFAEVNPMPKAGGQWNTFEITAKGRDITVVLNGETVSELNNGLFTEGPITLQHAAGEIKFRKVAIKPL